MPDFDTEIKPNEILHGQKSLYEHNDILLVNEANDFKKLNTSLADKLRESPFVAFGFLLISLTFFIVQLYAFYVVRKRENLRKALNLKIQTISTHKRVNSAMVLGIGGVGKTSLIKALTQSNLANPNIKTNEYSIYDYVVNKTNSNSSNNSHSKKTEQYQIYLSDYAGAELNSLIRGFLEQQFIHYSPMRYNSVNSLILVVDLFSPPSLPDEQVSKSDYIDEKRIQENIDYWDEKALSFVFGMLTDSLKYICLFINKVDLLDTEEINEDEANEIKKKYDTLFKQLSLRSSGIFLTRILGSAATGKNVEILREHLLQYSVKPE